MYTISESKVNVFNGGYNGISIERMPPAQASNLGGVILHGGGLSAVLGPFHVFSE